MAKKRRRVKDMPRKQQKAVMAKIKGSGPVSRMPRFYPSQYLSPSYLKREIPGKIITRSFVIGAMHFFPVAREISIGCTTARFIHSSWKLIYQAYRERDILKHQTYDFIRDEAKAGLASHQTSLIWGKIEDKVPQPLKHGVYESLTNVMSNVTEEEISLVENALSAF